MAPGQIPAPRFYDHHQMGREIDAIGRALQDQARFLDDIRRGRVPGANNQQEDRA